jgi:hypothetical protein
MAMLGRSRGPSSRSRSADAPSPRALVRGRATMYKGAGRNGREHGVRTTGLIFAIMALGLMVAGCDRCGDWYSPFENPFKPSPHSCRNDGSQPQK